MRIRARYLGAALAAAVVVAGTVDAVSAGAASAAPAPCGIKDISFYYGGMFEGLSLRTFDITLLARSGISCSLKDTPLVTVSGPPSSAPVAVGIGGRGGSLTLRPDLPLHATVAYHVPDTPEDTSQVNVLALAMPDGTSAATFFEFPGTTDIATSGGVTISSWDTGIGPGLEDQG